ncbi:MAG TPA: T9SS type A sorting domain-containing protein [Bacteroidia bacterium]|jgi:hypothetical protein|nr:T9SS type A sorting domain-containing protein [Bacteroidia bacterium]
MKKNIHRIFACILVLCVGFGTGKAINPAQAANMMAAASLQTITYPPVSICPGTSTTLDAGCGFSSFLWSNNATTQTITVSAAGNYSVTVTDNHGFSYILAYTVNVYTAPVVNLGTGITLCGTTMTALDAGPGFSSYSWNTGNLNETIHAGIGTYTVTVTDANGCKATGSTTITQSPYCSTLPCGTTYTTMYTYQTCSPVAGAIGYRFTFYEPSTGAVVTSVTQASNYIYFQYLTGLYYNHTYNWTVEVEISSGVFGPISNPNCSITFGPPLSYLPCGLSYNNMNTYQTCLWVPNAVNYRFTFIDQTVPGSPIVVVQPSNYIYFYQVPGLMYTHNYTWTVEVQYNSVDINGTPNGTAWGPATPSGCTIDFTVPMSSLPCSYTFPTMNTHSNPAYVPGATMYQINFYTSPTATTPVITLTQNTYIYFYQMPALLYNQTYYWTVSVQYPLSGGGTAWGPPSSQNCYISFAPPAPVLPCGNTYTNLSGYTGATSVPNAIAYRYKVYNPSDLVNPYSTYTSASNYVYFNNFTSPNALVSNSYVWTVEVEYPTPSGPVWSAPSSNTCTMTYSTGHSMIENMGSGTEEQKPETGDASEITEAGVPVLNAYPNPSNSGSMVLEMKGAENASFVTYSILDAYGKVVLNLPRAARTEILNTTDLKPGVYLVRALVDGKETVKRIVIQ